ncbi:helix-turn-helix domain-containing protein [Flavobacterium sp.]|uniref:helix-turn-helix domain-containing protein n=1 Tax=Flavobacterium sp. TaxID=239 RepID=UPI002FDA4E0B
MSEVAIAVVLQELQKTNKHLEKLTASYADQDILDSADMKLLFKICDKTLYRWRKKQYFPSRKMGGKYFYSKRIIMAILRTRLETQYHSITKPGAYTTF